MIYVSTSCIKADKIVDSVITLKDEGFKNIELSGGTEYYEDMLEDLIRLKDEFKLNFSLHNYFPPPKEHFVLNLASLNNDIYTRSMNHYKIAIEWSEKLGAEKFGLHSGFLIDPNFNELGKKIGKSGLYNREEAIERFCDAFQSLSSLSGKVMLYIENNVISEDNYKKFECNPFLFTNYAEYMELKNYLDFNVLLDMAHLKVSCQSLQLDFEGELELLLPLSDYIHISDNDGKSDTNQSFSEESQMFNLLARYLNNTKIITLEIYEDIERIKSSFKLISKIKHIL